MSKKVKIIIISVVAVVGIGGFIGIKAFNNVANKKTEQVSVDLYTIPGKEKVYLTGKITPKQSESFMLDGNFGSLDKINVKDGQAVQKGVALFSMKNEENISQVSTLKTQLANKQKELTNAPDEEAKKMINSEITDLNTQIKDLEKKTYKTVYAPFAGNIYIPKESVGSTEEGEGAGTPILVLETGEYHINTKINEMDLLKIKEGQDVNITITPSKKTAKGKITSISKRPMEGGDTQGSYDGSASFSNYPVKIDVEDQKDFINGFGVQAVAEFGKNENKVPLSAVLEENGKYFVMKVENDIAKKSEIKVKDQSEEAYIVTEGLNENDVLVRDALNPNIVDGQNIYGITN
ncbi:MAG: efflux RND transporter periplasmic adaptor subunit [Sarcina sp.]